MAHLEQLLEARIDDSFALYDELIASLSGDDLTRKLPVPSNTIGSQLWCVIGARESWARAIENGAWAGFACSITSRADIVNLDAMAGALASSGAAVRRACKAAPPDDEARANLKLQLLAHESQHQGQILRYLLGLGLTVPAGWKKQFAL